MSPDALSRRAAAMIVMALAMQASAAALAQSSTQTAFPDSTLFGAFSFDSGVQNVQVSACGKLGGTSGCFGSANLGPFGHVCAMIQERPGYNATNGNIARMIYVFDDAAGAAHKNQQVIIFRRTDNITGTIDTISIKKVKTVILDLGNGSLTAKCMMVANSSFIYAAVYSSGAIERIDKSNYSTTLLTPFLGQTVSSLTTDSYGFVNATGLGVAGPNAWQTYNPDGTSAASGAGSQYLVGSPTSLDTGNIPTTDAPIRNSQSLKHQ